MKKFSQEFKDSAVAVYEQGGVTYRQLALELGVSQASLKKWVSDARQGETTLSGEDMEELKRLRKENKRLRIEREILKKAAAFFAEESTQRG
jgi:transposase